MAAPALAGARAASTRGIIVFMDGDGAEIAAMADMVVALRPGEYDFVIGLARAWRSASRQHELAPDARRLSRRARHRALYGVRYTDMCAYRAIRRDSLLASTCAK